MFTPSHSHGPSPAPSVKSPEVSRNASLTPSLRQTDPKAQLSSLAAPKTKGPAAKITHDLLPLSSSSPAALPEVKPVAGSPPDLGPQRAAHTLIPDVPHASHPMHATSSSSAYLDENTAGGFVRDESNGSHHHRLKSARRQEKLGGMLRDILGTGKKVRDDAVSAIPDLGLTGGKSSQKHSNVAEKDPLSLMSGLVSQIRKGEADAGHVVKNSSTEASLSLIQKYGKCQEIIGKGAYGTVRVAHKFDRNTQCEILYAVKEFKRRSQENEGHFHKRLTSEFCISSSLHDINIIYTLDLMKDTRGEYCQVMEYCDGGDLYSLILARDGGLHQDEADCFFKQLIRGVVYMHSMGIAHCDLKPENLLLTTNGVLKISDFGNAECFRMAWETEVHLSNGVCGSRPYIAPEQFRDKEFDPRGADVWAIGVIYMAMRSGSYLWQVAVPDEDEYYEKYIKARKKKNGYEQIETLRRVRCRNVIYSILDPSPVRRISAKQVLNSEWLRGVVLCEAGDRGY